MNPTSNATHPSDADVTQAGGADSLIHHFAIEGLYGYRSISLDSPFAATVLIAKNGSGKSTLLGALDAVLKCQFHRLLGLEFSRIILSVRGADEPLVITDTDIRALAEPPPESELTRLALAAEVDIISMRKFLTEDYPLLKGDYTELNEDRVFNGIMKAYGYSYQRASDVCQKVISDMYISSPNLSRIQGVLKGVLKDVEVVYLPTFRRVELPLQSDRGRARRAKLRFAASSSLYGGDIQFGLGDIQQRLSDLNGRILRNSNNGYRRITANIISELIDGTFERDSFESDKIPDRESLELFFSRLREGVRQIGPFPDVSIPDVDKIYGPENIGVESRKTLRYFLSKLYDVIESTKDIELRVDEFVGICNKYLNDDDESATTDGLLSATSRSTDSKKLLLNRRDLKVYALSTSTNRMIPLDSLSSGEKQMVSLFAKLYLYEKDKIILIDEPELSMSLKWQRQILADLITAPLSRQVIAITHSPFIFDNALEPFARSLDLRLDVDGLAPEDTEYEDHDV